MIFKESARPVFAIASLMMFLAAACGTRPIDTRESEKTDPPPMNIQKERTPQPVPPPARQAESAGHRAKPATIPPPDPLPDEAPSNDAVRKIDWGREATLEEIIAMAKSDQIQQIEWHVMPNIVRAQTRDNRIFHIRNENKGIDARKALIDAGIRIGSGGVAFRHVF